MARPRTNQPEPKSQPDTQETVAQETARAPSGPTWLFHRDHPKGRVFQAAEVAERMKSGWVDSPAKLVPGKQTG